MTGYLRMIKVTIFVVWDKKWCLVKYKKCGTLPIHVLCSDGHRGAPVYEGAGFEWLVVRYLSQVTRLPSHVRPCEHDRLSILSERDVVGYVLRSSLGSLLDNNVSTVDNWDLSIFFVENWSTKIIAPGDVAEAEKAVELCQTSKADNKWSKNVDLRLQEWWPEKDNHCWTYCSKILCKIQWGSEYRMPFEYSVLYVAYSK